MKLPKGKVLGKFPPRHGVILDVLAGAPKGLNGYIRVVGPEGSGKIGVVLLIGGEPIGCLVTGNEQLFGRPAVGQLRSLAEEEGSQVRLIGFYEDALMEVQQAADNMRKVAAISRQDLERASTAKGSGPAPPAEAQAVADAMKAPSRRPPKPEDPAFFRELLETGLKAAREESQASGDPMDPDLAANLEDYLARSDLQLDDAIATFATALSKKGPEAVASEAKMPPVVKQEFDTQQKDLERTAKKYEYMLTKDMASAKALRDQEQNLQKMETSLKDLKSSVQVEGEKRLQELKRESQGRENEQILKKLRDEQEAMYARVEKLVQMESLFKQNLITQRRRIQEKETELQQLAAQLKQDFLERKRLLDEEKESYLDELRRQSKDLKTREAVAVEREKRAAELAERLETDIKKKIEEIESQRLTLEKRERELESQAEALAAREAERSKKPSSDPKAKEAAAALESERKKLAHEREEFASKIASLSKREEELKSVEARLERAEAEGKGAMKPEDLEEVRRLVSYLDKLLEDLPPEKISEFAASEFYKMYVRLLERLGI